MLGSLQVSTFYPMATYQTAFGFDIVCERGGISYNPHNLTVTTQLEDQPSDIVRLEHNSPDGAYDKEWSSFAAWVLRDEDPVLDWRGRTALRGDPPGRVLERRDGIASRPSARPLRAASV